MTPDTARPHADAEPICARCARERATCCQISEVYASPADVRRIAAYVGGDGFTELRAPADADYADQDDDPAWQRHVFRSDGTRRVLRRRPNGDCTFLGERGCRLPEDVRPVVCRLYPYEYDEGGLTGVGDGCPLHLLAPGQTILDALGMRRAQAEDWHAQLYREIREEALP